MISISRTRLKFRIDKLINLICGFDAVFSPYHVHRHIVFMFSYGAACLDYATAAAAYMRGKQNWVQNLLFALCPYILLRVRLIHLFHLLSAGFCCGLTILWLAEMRWIIDWCGHFKETLIMVLKCMFEVEPLSGLVITNSYPNRNFGEQKKLLNIRTVNQWVC